MIPELVSTNYDPAVYRNGESFYGVTEPNGLQNPRVDGFVLLPPYDGHRGVEDVSFNGTEVLLVKAVGSTRDQNIAIPGKGVNNTLAVFDRAMQKEFELFPRSDFGGWFPKRHSIMWADFSPDATMISWTQRYKSGDLAGFWELHVADVRRSFVGVTLENERVWRPAPDAFTEVYGWVPDTNRIIFTSSVAGGGMLNSKLYYIDADTLGNITPVPESQGPGYYEFANFNLDGDLLASRTYKAGKGGVDLWNLTTGERLTYFNGDKGVWGNTIAVPGWPAPSYTNVLGGQLILPDGSIVVGVARDLAVAQVTAYRLHN